MNWPTVTKGANTSSSRAWRRRTSRSVPRQPRPPRTWCRRASAPSCVPKRTGTAKTATFMVPSCVSKRKQKKSLDRHVQKDYLARRASRSVQRQLGKKTAWIATFLALSCVRRVQRQPRPPRVRKRLFGPSCVSKRTTTARTARYRKKDSLYRSVLGPVVRPATYMVSSCVSKRTAKTAWIATFLSSSCVSKRTGSDRLWESTKETPNTRSAKQQNLRKSTFQTMNTISSKRRLPWRPVGTIVERALRT